MLCVVKCRHKGCGAADIRSYRLTMTEPSFPPMLEDLRATGGVPDMDYEIHEEFEHPDETAWWYRLWTGNQEADGGGFRFFGREGTGDHTGLWPVREGRSLVERPCAPDPDVTEVARRHVPDGRRTPAEILDRAAEEFPHLQEYIDAQCV